ncbi:MAG: hypothetical protein AVDCRST_MAG18-4225 [uncultured Thermomicrobiales bacterium]|uniref:Uncharacterized protein n=1 Tax=uncultured Thermomicrobiales bacterium TaxID=1645740 RepID=A0A6J4VSU3_9BACT|nr:MAG: hypothetical protein AVDCRST_MAG18-4225 [uncultured Thermomicrobiales bacterium]
MLPQPLRTRGAATIPYARATLLSDPLPGIGHSVSHPATFPGVPT